MAAEQSVFDTASGSYEALPVHPLAPLTSTEIVTSRNLMQSLYPANTTLLFKHITLQEPLKAELAAYLDAEAAGQPVQSIERRAFINYYIRNTNKFHEAVVNLSQRRVEYNLRLGANKHGNVDAEDFVGVEKTILQHEEVKAAVAELKLPEGTVIICDPWTYGSDGVNDDERMYQCFLYMRDPLNSSFEDSNHYALPLPISPVYSMEHSKVVRIDIVPTGNDHSVKPVTQHEIKPPNEYTSEHQKLRTGLKPLHVVQPEGASFRFRKTGETGELIEWQKWVFRVGFNAREGAIIYDVRYDGRPLFYRISLSDMNIPYADPRHPFHKKSAFDLGDGGAGVLANDLKLGCDCLGSIHYLDGMICNSNGSPVRMPNAICVHEQDGGLSWKHTNYRTGRAALVRNRELVVQCIITAANYDYVLAYIFNQAGELHYEVRATGILSTQPIDPDASVPWGTVVHPGVLAAHHQHIFSLRIDPMLDGHANRLVYEEALPMPRSEFNPHGVGYYTAETIVDKSSGLDAAPDNGRVFKIQNPAVRNPVNGKPVAYKIQSPPFQKLLADKASFHHRRAEFADHDLYVLPYREGELFSAGRYTNQSRGGDGVRTWAARGESVVDTDIVLFVQFGLQHVPRTEDFPVMPAEVLRVALKPVNYFDKNPALDVPAATQEFNRSSLVAEQHCQPAGEGGGAGTGGEGKVGAAEGARSKL